MSAPEQIRPENNTPYMRMRFLHFGFVAVMGACAVFAPARAWVEYKSGLLTPWWVNAVGLVLTWGLFQWYKRRPLERLDLGLHLLASTALILIWIPLLYGMESTIWWLTLVGFSTSLMASRKEALIWAVVVIATVVLSALFRKDVRLPGTVGETAIEAWLSMGVFAIVLMGLAFAFRRESDAANVRLAESAEQLRIANSAKGRFLAHMSHELRTPLHGVIAMSEHALLDELSEVQRRRLQTVQGSAQVLLRLLNDVLDISRAESDALVLDQRPFRLHANLHEVLMPFEIQARDAGLTFTSTASAGLPEARVGDSVRIRQIALNLLANALKFTPHGKIEFHLRPWDAFEDGVEIGVRDTGIGIAEDDIQRLAKPFVQIDSSSTRVSGGAGLGLSIVGELAKRMQGELCIESEIGKGSEFKARVRLPLDRQHQEFGPSDLLLASATSATMPAIQVESPGAGKRILICEDNLINQLVLTETLQALGHSFVVAGNGVEGLRALKAEAFDCVFTDIEMPGMDGFQLLWEIRAWERSENHERNRVFAVTAHAKPEDRQRFETEGFDGYLPKPFQIADVEALLRD